MAAFDGRQPVDLQQGIGRVALLQFLGLRLRTGVGHTWTEQRVYSARRYHLLPAFDPQRASRFVTLEQAAQRLGVSPTTVRRLIRHEKLDGLRSYPVRHGRFPLRPWIQKRYIGQWSALRTARASRKLHSCGNRTLCFQQISEVSSMYQERVDLKTNRLRGAR